MVELEAVLDLLDKRSDGTEVILTGRGASKGLIDHADLVSQIQEIKHPFTKGIKARIGIEY